MDYYFGSYAETEIHEVMLKDAVRTESYRDCFYLNKDFFKDKIVLDVGCGTGILSMFAAKSGAKHVYAVDNSTIILKAKEIVQRNGLSDKITFIRGEVEHIQLPVETVDCIVSEWMGYFLLFEGMFDSVITARDRWLAPDGIMAPSYANIQIAGLEDADWVNDKYHFWNDVYGFDYSCMKGTFLDDGQVDIARKDSIISEPFVIKELALDSITPPELDFKTPFTLKFTKKARLHALCGWFDIRFDFPAPGATPVFFSTGPAATPTHWKQTTFVLDGALDVDTGSVLEGVFECKKSKENARELEVVVEYVVPASGEKKRQTFTVR
ncbi:S-adenosyl-L-methionine-dependent methyltransferase [Chytriomyces sp. MP71]|nr:S-adenosyl-L-methionine-dependent methyltransferase [Chytriomyces sp. MP71]